MTVLHYIDGRYAGEFNNYDQYDTSLRGLSILYGVGWESIAMATMGTTSGSAITAWLRDNGGVEQTPGVYSFAPGMVAEIPGVSVSLSPPPSSGGIPAGPGVEITPEGDVAVAPDGVRPQTASVGGLGMWLLMGVATFFMFPEWFSGKKKKKRTYRKKRKTTRRRKKTYKRRR